MTTSTDCSVGNATKKSSYVYFFLNLISKKIKCKHPTLSFLKLFSTSVILLYCASSFAGLGSFLNGSGTNNRALSGAGVAFSEDGMVMAINPAGLSKLENSGWLFGSIFLRTDHSADIGEVPPTSSGDFSLPSGKRHADPDVTAEIEDIFIIPFGAVHYRINERNTIGLVLYGNGGMNVTYQGFENTNCPSESPQSGYFCFGKVSSDLAQFFLSPTWSYQFNSRLNFGAGVQLIYQTVEINGYQILSPLSSRPSKLSNNGHSGSFGYGLKLGSTLQAADNLTFGLTLQSEGKMDEHNEYSGLFPNHGTVNIAPYIHFGVAWNASYKITLLADFQKIYFSEINAYANSPNSPGRFGDCNGPGFGWNDLTVAKFGVHYRHTNKTTFRIGYADVLKEPIHSDVLFNNFVSTAVFDQRYSLGISWSYDDANTIDVGIGHAPRQDLASSTPSNPDQSIRLSNSLSSVDIGWRRSF